MTKASTPGTVLQRALAALGADQADRLLLAGQPAEDLLATHGSPLYVYDGGVALRQLQSVRAAFGARVQVLYAMKANPFPDLVANLAKGGIDGADVASAGEIHIACDNGIAADTLHFAGPGKRDGELLLGLERSIGVFNLESEHEYEVFADLCRQQQRTPRVAIRVNPKDEVSGSRMRMGGGSKKFGVDEDRVGALAERILADGAAQLIGLHVYAGTQSFDADAWIQNARDLHGLATTLETQLDHRLASLNFGGGFGVACYENDGSFDLQAAGRGVAELIAQDNRDDRRYFLELGRYLVAPAGVFLTRVLYTKPSAGRDFAILDGGMQHHAAAAGIGSVLKRNWPVVACDRLRHPELRPVTLAGPLCTPQDELGRDVLLPPLRRGDALAFLVSGAYGPTYSPTGFLSHPPPGEIALPQQ